MISTHLQEKLEEYIRSCGCALYGIEMHREHGQDILRVSIYSKEGVGLDQCQKVSDLISPFLDVEDPISSQYVLEVSSPGVERVLREPRHFRFSVGEEIEVKMLDGAPIKGVLRSSDEEGFLLENEEGARHILYAQTKKVKTIFRW